MIPTLIDQVASNAIPLSSWLSVELVAVFSRHIRHNRHRADQGHQRHPSGLAVSNVLATGDTYRSPGPSRRDSAMMTACIMSPAEQLTAVALPVALHTRQG
jgi:hypothetical protein